jgi:16S rRNA (adenine1518-N6/adenine1519-N6)-dimethyltransferase
MVLHPQKIIKKYNLTTSKSLGQNFLTNPELLEKIVKQCDHVFDRNFLEIGIGPCGLTSAILEQKPKKLITVDVDDRCVNIAKQELVGFDNLSVILADAIKINEKELFNGEKFSIISNLPYNIGTVLLFKWLENYSENIEQMVLLLQKEVVDRIIAKKNTKEYGRISVLCQYLCEVNKCFDVQNTAFTPPPKVTSSVVKMTLKKNIDFSLIRVLSDIILKAFSKRRKTLYNNLRGFIKNVDEIFEKLNLNKNMRAEELSIGDFVELARSDFAI